MDVCIIKYSLKVVWPKGYRRDLMLAGILPSTKSSLHFSLSHDTTFPFHCRLKLFFLQFLDFYSWLFSNPQDYLWSRFQTHY